MKKCHISTFKLGKNAAETFGMMRTAYGDTYMSSATVFHWQKRFQDGREEVRDEEQCGRERDVRKPDTHISIMVTSFLTEMAIKTVPHPP